MTTTESPADFDDLLRRHRRELLAHCYRMVGSATEAEDLVQETFLRAWRSYDDFEGRASASVIATSRRSLEKSAEDGAGMRTLPTGE